MFSSFGDCHTQGSGLVNPDFYMNVTDVIADYGMLGGTANATLKSQIIKCDIYTILATYFLVVVETIHSSSNYQ